LNEEVQDTKESAKSSAGSCGFMKNFIGPIITCKPEFSTP
jgi:calcium/calmodulin-dependent protein kinase I/calcium-dependent protein kinase